MEQTKRMMWRRAFWESIMKTVVDPTSCPYLLQSKANDSETKNEDDSPSTITKSFQAVKQLMPIIRFLKLLPSFRTCLNSLKDHLQGNPICALNATTKVLSQTCTLVNFTIFDTAIQAVLDTRAPTTIVSSSLVDKLQYNPDLDYNENFATAGN